MVYETYKFYAWKAIGINFHNVHNIAAQIDIKHESFSSHGVDFIKTAVPYALFKPPMDIL